MQFASTREHILSAFSSALMASVHDERLTIVTNDVSGHKIVRVAGQIDSATAPRFEKHLQEVLGKSPRFGLDCGGVDYVSSAGIRVLISTAKQVKGMAGRFEMFALTPGVSRMIEISGLTTILSIRSSEKDTLEALERA
jgi:anti-anti-sigma factor